MADCERALGRPQNALKLAKEAARRPLDPALRIEMTIVEAGARADLGQVAEARRILDRARPTDRPAPALAAAYARLRYAYADLLLRADQPAEAREAFARAAELDTEQQTDAQQRVDELDGVLIEFDDEPESGVTEPPPRSSTATTPRSSTWTAWSTWGRWRCPGRRRGSPPCGSGTPGWASSPTTPPGRRPRSPPTWSSWASRPAADDVVTSAQAGAHLVLDRFGPGARVLVVGGEGVAAALAEAGLVGVWSADDEPVAVLQGWGFELTWQQLNEAAIAIHRGAHWVATNTDPTRPTDRGLVPGNGAAVAAVAMAVPVTPEVAGKPFRPLLDDTVARLGARRPVFVGDRLDTDIAGAVNAGLDSMLVLTGSHGAADLLLARPGERPTHLGYDLRALLEPPLVVMAEDDGWRCGPAWATVARRGGAADRRTARNPGRHLGRGARRLGGWPIRVERSTR